MAQIDDFRNVGGFDEAVEKPDLTARILDARNGDMTRQEVRQSRRLIGKVERRDRAPIRHVVLGKKPRQHGLADLPVRRAHDIEGPPRPPALLSAKKVRQGTAESSTFSQAISLSLGTTTSTA